MSSSIINEVRSTADKLGSCDPIWLRKGVEPSFSFRQEGTGGPELVLLHGLFGALSNWETVIPILSSYCRPIALEFPILSSHRSEVKIKALAVFLQYFILQRGLAPVSLCGNSLGGHVALRLCLAAPELVDCLILTGTSGLYEHSTDSLPVRPDHRFVREHMGRVFYDRSFVTDEAVNEIAQILTSRNNVLNLIHSARSAKKDNLQKFLKNIQVPTLLLWGEEDEITTMDVAEMFHKLIPNSKLVTVKNCGHAPMLEHPKWFGEQVEQFLRKHSRAYKS